MSDEAATTPASQPARPPRWRDWRFWVGGTGRVLLTIGLLMFGFVAYQLWGTSIEYHQHQHALADEFAARQAELATSTTAAPSTTTTGAPSTVAPATAAPTTAPTAATSAVATAPAPTTRPTTPPTAAAPTTTSAPSVVASRWPAIHLGEVLAVVEIPRIHKKVYAVAGTRTQDLKRGLGHYPDTPLPGQLGNVAFAGHRTTYGAPLYDIDELSAGDEIIVTTITNERFVYRVTGPARVVAPNDYGVIRNSDPTRATLTLTSCHPRYSARKRIVVTATLDTSQSAPPEPATPYYGQTVAVVPAGGAPGASPDDSAPTGSSPDDPTVTEPTGEVVLADGRPAPQGAEALSEGWFADPGAWWHVGFWGLGVAAIGAGAYLLSRRTRRWWLGPVAAVAPFLVVLYFFYQNVARLLPPGL